MRRTGKWLICPNLYVQTPESVSLLTTLQIELKLKYKYRLVLDESFSFGTVGRTGRGLTELYNVPVSSLLPQASIALNSPQGVSS